MLCFATLRLLFSALLLQLFMLEYSEVSAEGANPCHESSCRLPECFCSGTAIPGNLRGRETPQMITLTFQNAITELYATKYLQLFNRRQNPNGCPAAGTFFVSHEYTDYYSVQQLASQRHEIGVNSVTWPPQDSFRHGSEQFWVDEMGDQKTILKLMANIGSDRVKGERAPYLQMGGNNQMKMLQRLQLLYDASRVSTNMSHMPNLLWPYTYDFDSTQDCPSPPCPTASFSGIWQIPILAFTDKEGHFCPVLQACKLDSTADVVNLLFGTFLDHYFTNKAPMVIVVDAAFVATDYKLQGLYIFLNYIQGLRDTYIVPAKSVIDWIQNPTPVRKLRNFKPWRCDDAPPSLCHPADVKTCTYNKDRTRSSKNIYYRTRTCMTCPKCYPWLHDPLGQCKNAAHVLRYVNHYTQL